MFWLGRLCVLSRKIYNLYFGESELIIMRAYGEFKPENETVRQPIGSIRDPILLDDIGVNDWVIVDTTARTVESRDMGRMLKLAMGGLSEKQRKVLTMSYGLEDGVGHSLGEMKKILKRSRTGIVQMERRAVARLRNSSYVMQLADDMNFKY